MLNKDKIINRINKYNNKLDEILIKLDKLKDSFDDISITKQKYYIDRYDYIILLMKLYNKILLNHNKINKNNNTDINISLNNNRSVVQSDNIITNKIINKKMINKKIIKYHKKLDNIMKELDVTVKDYNNKINEKINKIKIKNLINKSEYYIYLIDVLSKI